MRKKGNMSIIGTDAIAWVSALLDRPDADYTEETRPKLMKHTDPTEDACEISVADAWEIARVDPALIYFEPGE
jgi:hypothetical protein